MTAQFYSLKFNIDESTLTVRFTSQEDVLSIADPEIRVKMLSAILDRVDEQVDRVILDLSDLSRVNSLKTRRKRIFLRILTAAHHNIGQLIHPVSVDVQIL